MFTLSSLYLLITGVVKVLFYSFVRPFLFFYFFVRPVLFFYLFVWDPNLFFYLEDFIFLFLCLGKFIFLFVCLRYPYFFISVDFHANQYLYIYSKYLDFFCSLRSQFPMSNHIVSYCLEIQLVQCSLSEIN